MQPAGETPPETNSGLALFLKSLAEEGRAVVLPQPLDDDVEEATAVLEQLDTHARNELALDAPAFSAPAAVWGARLLYQFAQFTVCRDLGEERIRTACSPACPERRG